MTAVATTVTLLTAPGRGAIATLVVRGPHALEAVSSCFRPASGQSLATVKLQQIVFGAWRSGEESSEELVLCRVAHDEFEVHCHGGSAAVEAIVTTLRNAGVEYLSPENWTLEVEVDRLAAEARLALTRAVTQLTAEHLLAQYNGALRLAIEHLLTYLARGEHADAEILLEQLLQLAPLGLHLTQPWRVVLAGHPNVGKSSLMNTLVGYNRSIVFEQPGTTRDTVTAATAISGWPVEIVDTAGLRTTTQEIEAAGVLLAEAELAQADLVLLVADAALEWPADYDRLLSQASDRTLVVFNKIDLSAAEHYPLDACAVSARFGTGMEILLSEIARRLVPHAPPVDAALPFNERQIELLRSTRTALRGH